MSSLKRVFITDCEGPISKNDNAFELSSHFIPDGEHFFKQLSKYDDVLAYVVEREGYNAGDTLRLIVPFLKAYNVTNEKMADFSKQNISLMPRIRETLRFIKEMPSFIVSTSFEHYIKALCKVLNFPFENTFCTRLDIDSHSMDEQERRKMEQLRQQICQLPLIGPSDKTNSIKDLTDKEQRTVKQLDDIFWEKIMTMESGKFLNDVKPVGGDKKAQAAEEIVNRMGTDLSEVIYVGDSITDVECFRLVRQNGGVTISFNGNEYAVREAEIAIISADALPLAVTAQAFVKFGHDAVYELVDHWEHGKFTEFQINPELIGLSTQVKPSDFVKTSLITEENVETLAKESSLFRKCVRGEEIGKLG